MASAFCSLCQNVVDKLFVRSLYELGNYDTAISGDTHRLDQRFPHVGRNHDLVASSQSCSLCALLKDTLYRTYLRSPRTHSVQDFEESWLGPSTIFLHARGGNWFRVPSQPGGGLQLCTLYINTMHGYFMGDSVSFYAAKGKGLLYP
jgi:hypothetical protein